MKTLPVVGAPTDDCWNRIGIRGDRSCPELAKVGHCHNCPVFAAAGRHFLDAPSPPGYLAEWTERLAAPLERTASDLQSVLVFRLADEWLGLPVQVLVEVTGLRPVHRVPFRSGLLAGLVNIRGELHLCVHLAELLGIQGKDTGPEFAAQGPHLGSSPGQALEPRAGGPSDFARVAGTQGLGAGQPRLLVVQREAERWVFPVDEVDQVYRFSIQELGRVPATVARAGARLTRSVLHWQDRSVGILDDQRLFETLRVKTS